MRNKVMITCDEATTICDKSQYGEASNWEILKLNIHLLMCKHCRSYSKQNTYISKLLGTYLDSGCKRDKLLENDKEDMKEKLKLQIKEVSDE